MEAGWWQCEDEEVESALITLAALFSHVERTHHAKQEDAHKHLAEVFGINLDVDPPMRTATLSETEDMAHDDSDEDVKPTRRKAATRAKPANGAKSRAKPAAAAKKTATKGRGKKKKEETDEERDEEEEKLVSEIDDSEDGGEKKHARACRTRRQKLSCS